MRHLVPQRRHPVEIARWTGARRVEGDHLPEAGPQRPEHARQPEGAHRKVVVVREHLDEDRRPDRHVVARGQLVERFLGEVQHVPFEDRRLVGMEPHDEVPALDGHELVEVVHHLQQVEGDDVVGIVLERPLQRHARARLVPGAQEVHPELGVGARVGRIERQRAPDERDRLGEAVGPRDLTARDPVDVAVRRVDRQHPLDLGGEVVSAVLQVGDGGKQRARLQAARVDRERPLDRLARGVAVPVAELELRNEQMRPDAGFVDAEGALHRPAGDRGVLVRQHPRHADQGRHPFLVQLQRILKRLQRVGIVVLLEEQLAPRGVDRRIVGQRPRGPAQERVGPPEAAGGARGERAVVLRQPVERVQAVDDDRLEERHRLADAAERHEQPCELETGHAAGVGAGDGVEQRLGLAIVPDVDQQPGAERRGSRIGRVAAGGQLLRRLAVPVCEGTGGVPVELLVLGDLVGGLSGARRRRRREQQSHGEHGRRRAAANGIEDRWRRARRPAGARDLPMTAAWFPQASTGTIHSAIIVRRVRGLGIRA